MNLLGIYREPEYSPGRHLSNDARILRLVGEALKPLEVDFQLLALDEARLAWRRADLIFSMLQGPNALAELAEWKAQGAVIVNDPESSRRTYRNNLCLLLRHQELPFPRHLFLPTDGSVNLERYESFFSVGGAWLKRPDVHAMEPGDVIHLQSLDDLGPALGRFQNRGLSQAVLQDHVDGDEVKFYAVQGHRFFWPYYPKDCQGYPFDEKRLQAIAESAADALGIGVYGGDAIISVDGQITLIDLNDWPSFAPCRGAAASAIARYLKETCESLKNLREAPPLAI